MDIVLIDENNIREMVRIWNQNKIYLSENRSEKTISVDYLNNWKDKDALKFYGVIVDEDINDELGGFFVLSESDDLIILEHMAIADEHKRKGVGDTILRYCKYQAKERFNNNIKLHIYSHNIGGINFFFDTGFIIEDFNSEKCQYTMVLKD
jgi:GNAT superfamily N-acetyltransferase